jgi:hypothetical protein
MVVAPTVIGVVKETSIGDALLVLLAKALLKDIPGFNGPVVKLLEITIAWSFILVTLVQPTGALFEWNKQV